MHDFFVEWLILISFLFQKTSRYIKGCVVDFTKVIINRLSGTNMHKINLP